MRLLRRASPGHGPARAYLVCGVERTGSSLLCSLLEGTGLAGRPWEYFNDHARLEGLDWRLPDREYVAALLETGTTPNGVFGAKVMWGHMDDLRRRLRGFHGAHGLPDRRLLARTFPRLRYVLVTRDDVVAQAVSWVKAIQTGQWAAPDPRRGDPVYDFEQIHAHVERALADREAWEGWFPLQRAEPFRVTYEQLDRDRLGVAARVLEFLGISLPPGASVAEGSWYARQADAVNEEWIARYRADAARR